MLTKGARNTLANFPFLALCFPSINSSSVSSSSHPSNLGAPLLGSLTLSLLFCCTSKMYSWKGEQIKNCVWSTRMIEVKAFFYNVHFSIYISILVCTYDINTSIYTNIACSISYLIVVQRMWLPSLLSKRDTENALSHLNSLSSIPSPCLFFPHFHLLPAATPVFFSYLSEPLFSLTFSLSPKNISFFVLSLLFPIVQSACTTHNI